MSTLNSDLLLERLAREIGVGITNQEMLKIQLEEAQAETQAALAAKLATDSQNLSIGQALRTAQLENEELRTKLEKYEGAKPKPTRNQTKLLEQTRARKEK